MNLTLKTSGILLSSLLLAACGSDSDNHSDAHEEHGHALMISQQNTTALSFLEEGEAENLADAAAANGAALLLSNTGELGAIITAGQVQFVAVHLEEEEGEANDEGEHELPELSTLELSSTAEPIVANTVGHFSVLVDGATQLVPYELLEEGQIPDSETLSLGITETYPAFVLEEDALVIGFDGDTVEAYEDTGSGFVAEGTSLECEDVKSAAHTRLIEDVDGTPTTVADFVVVSCNNTVAVKNYKLELKHETDTLTAASLMPTINVLVDWKARANVFVGKGDDNKFYVAEEDHDTGALELVNAQGFDATENSAELCAWGIDSEAADIFALTANTLTVYDHEGGVADTISLDNSTRSTCADLRMAAASQAVLVVDNAAQVVYEIDKEADVYHVHGKEDLGVNDVESMLIFHEVGEVAGDHDH